MSWILRACSFPPSSRNGQFDDSLPERSSPDGYYFAVEYEYYSTYDDTDGGEI